MKTSYKVIYCLPAILILLSACFAFTDDSIQINYHSTNSGVVLSSSNTTAALSVFPKWNYKAVPLKISVDRELISYKDEIAEVLKAHYQNNRGSTFCPKFAIVEEKEEIQGTDQSSKLSRILVMPSGKNKPLAILDFYYESQVDYYSSDSLWTKPVISKLDISLRKDFFKREKIKYTADLATIFHHSAGHPTTIWENDLLQSRYVAGDQQVKFSKNKTWQEMSSSRNKLVYHDPVAEIVNTPTLLPKPDSILNISPLLASGLDNAPILFLTNIAAFDKKQSLKVTISRLDAKGKIVKKICKLSGHLPKYPLPFTKNRTMYVEFSSMGIGIGKANKLRAIDRNLSKFGKKKKLKGKGYKFALKVRVELEGFPASGGKPETIVQDYWLVKN